MDLLKPVTYSRDLDRLISTLLGDLHGVQLPSLAAAIGNPQHRIELDYKASRARKPLRLTEETGRPCGAARQQTAQAWIQMVSGTFAHATVHVLKAIVPATTEGAGLEALHPSIFGRLIWERQALSDLLGGRAAEIKLSLDIVSGAEAVEMKPTGLIDVERDPVIGDRKRVDFSHAERFVSQYWTGFCREAAPWLLGSGITKLVIAGKLSARDRLFMD